MIDRERHVGGRPAIYYDILKRFLPHAIRRLGRARPSDLVKLYRKEMGKSIGDRTIRRYLQVFVDEGILITEVEISNRDKVLKGLRRRDWNMVWYKLP